MGHLSTAQAARRLGVRSATVAAWCRDGRLPAEKVHGRWRIPAEALSKLQADARQEAGGSAAPLIVAAAGGRRGLYRMGALLGDLRAAGKGPLALGRRMVRKSAYRRTGRLLRKLLP